MAWQIDRSYSLKPHFSRTVCRRGSMARYEIRLKANQIRLPSLAVSSGTILKHVKRKWSVVWLTTLEISEFESSARESARVFSSNDCGVKKRGVFWRNSLAACATTKTASSPGGSRRISLPVRAPLAIGSR